MPIKLKKTVSTSAVTGNSVYFTGASQYLYTPTSASFDPGNTGAWTLECWFYPLNAAGGRIVEIGNGGAWGAALGISRQNTGTFAFYQSNGNNNSVWVGLSASTYAINNWYHLAVSKDSSNNIKCFINGVEDTTLRQTNVTATVPTNNSLRVNAANDNNGGQGSNGYTSNLRWIKGTALYTASFTAPTSPLTAIANTVLLTCQSPTIIDNSTNNFTITNNNTATVSSTITPFTTSRSVFKLKKNNANPTGPTNYSVLFNGTNQSLTVGSAANWTFLHNGSSFTAECWFNVPSASLSNQYTLMSTNAASANIGMTLGLNNVSAGDAIFTFYKGVSGQFPLNVVGNSGSFTPNIWNHIAAVYNSSTSVGTIYVNGVAIASASGSGLSTSAPTYTLAIGRYQHSAPGGYLNGYISNLRVVNGTALYTSSFTVPTTPLTAITNTQLLTCNAATIVDSSTNNFTITNNNTATVSSAITPFTASISTNKFKLRQVSYSPYMIATGGDLITTSGSYKIHTFTTVGTSSFVVSNIGNNLSVECLIVGGGGGGGGRAMAGGGGGGGVVYTSSAFLAIGSFSAIVGAGGIAATGMQASSGQNGGSTSFTYNGITTTALGGGGGATEGYVGLNGANGGGGTNGNGAGGAGVGGGFPGGSGSAENYLTRGCGGGGGGAGGAGVRGVQAIGGNGGVGAIYNITGSAYYGGGGGGGGNTNAGGATAGAGGLGGGGLGGRTSPGTAGTANTGGGGGGGGYTNTTGASETNGGNGGSGIILIKYRYTD